jgi:hypothetical protein
MFCITCRSINCLCARILTLCIHFLIHLFIFGKKGTTSGLRVKYQSDMKLKPLSQHIIVTCRPTARQRFRKHIPATKYVGNNQITSVSMQRRYNTIVEEKLLSMWIAYIRCWVKEMFSVTSDPSLYNKKSTIIDSWQLVLRVEVGSNTFTVTLRVVGGDEKGSLNSEKVKVASPKGLAPRQTALTRTGSIYKRQICPLVREVAPQTKP